jgi:hypothetical protein
MSAYLTSKKRLKKGVRIGPQIWLGMNEPLSTQSSYFLWILQKLQFNNNPFCFPELNALLLRRLVPSLPHIPLTGPVMSPVKQVCQKTCFESGTERWILKLSLHYLSVQKCFFNKRILFLSFWFSVIYAFACMCGMVDNKSE